MTTTTPPTPDPAKTEGSAGESAAYLWLKSYPPGVDWDMSFPVRSMIQLFDEAVAKYQRQICTHFLGKEMTYGEIGALVDRAAKGLQALGVEKGTRVGILLPNCPTFIIMYFAILKAGGVVVNMNPLYTEKELTYQVEDSGAELIVTVDLKLTFDKVEALLASGVLKGAIVDSFAAYLPGLKSFLFRLLKGKDLAKPEASAQRSKITLFTELTDNDGMPEKVSIDAENDLAVLQYTGGTTGVPKGAMLTHQNLTVNSLHIKAWATNLSDGGERFMCILPLFHVFAMTTVMNFGIDTGGVIILLPRFELDQALKLIHATKPTVMPGVPTIDNAMMNHPKIKKFDLSSLKFCISGGAALPIEVKRGFEAASGCKLVEGYGLSETSPVVTCNPIDGPVKEGSIGLPMPATRLSLRDLEDPSKEVPLGEKGEICVAGPQVMKGYWNKPEETEKAFVGEFFRTGDVAYMDEEGFTFIVDRIKDLIICSGYNVYPRQVEEAIYEFPAVEEVTVVGIPDDYRGEAPKAFIKLKEGESATAEEILDFLKDKLSKIEMPAEIEFRDELPKTMIGKLSKKELREEEEKRRKTAQG